MLFCKNINYSFKVVVLTIALTVVGCTKPNSIVQLSEQNENSILAKAEVYKNLQPQTITSFVCPRSAGGIHDFYSEGDYWWPDPESPDGPYIRKDGMSNPDNFNAHRKVLIELSKIVGTLSTAYLLTEDKTYLQHIIPHLKAWFVTKETKMNASLWYAQSIKGKVTGRGIGIIDTVHLIEVARAVEILEEQHLINNEDYKEVKQWFTEYITWLTSSSFGKAERDHGNNHSVTWALQVAAFAHLTKNKPLLLFCSNFYKTTLLPEQMATNGSFPLELARTKPYGYSIFVMDAMATLCQILTTKNDNLFTYTSANGKSLEKGMLFLYPYLKDKKKWPFKQDVMYWNDWPVNQPCLLFTGIACKKPEYIALWKTLKNKYDNHDEITRNMPVKHPLLWININK